MRIIKKISQFILITTLLTGCQINQNNINLEELFEEHIEEIKKVESYFDFKNNMSSEQIENYKMDIVLEKASLSNFHSYYGLSNVFGEEIHYKKVLYVQHSNVVIPFAFELKNSKQAKEYYERISSALNYELIAVKNNIIYTDKYNSHILLNNAKLVGNNYLTLDEKSLLTNLSYDEVINLPKVETIKHSALAYRTNLKEVHFSENTTNIKCQAFYSCINLKNVYFNYGLKEIATEAFYNCTSLDYVVIPDTVKYIGSKAFNSGTIFSNTTFIPESWADDFAVGKAKVYFKHRWYYDENGIPRPKDSI